MAKHRVRWRTVPVAVCNCHLGGESVQDHCAAIAPPSDVRVHHEDRPRGRG